MIDLEEVSYSLPSTNALLDKIVSSLGSGVVIVFLPDHLSRDMVGRLIRNHIEKASTIVLRELNDPGQRGPLEACADTMGASWPTNRTRRSIDNLLCCGNLPDLLYVHRIGPDSKAWSDFINGWAREYRNLKTSGQSNLPALCVVGKIRDFGLHLPTSTADIARIWWGGTPSVLELRLACRIANEESGDGQLAGTWREYVLPSVVGSDVQLAEHLWSDIIGDINTIVESLKTFWGNVQESIPDSDSKAVMEAIRNHQGTIGAGRELPEFLEGYWAKGCLVYSPEYGLEAHPALLAHDGNRSEVEKRIWRGEAELFLPILNELRLRVCHDLTGEYGNEWPVQWIPPVNPQELEQVQETPLATELGHIDYLFRNTGTGHQLDSKRHLANLVRNARRVRNEIAHYKPVVYQDFEDLLEERGKVGL